MCRNGTPRIEWLFDTVQISMAAGSGNALYVGFNRGELPGGVKLISEDIGRTVTVDRRQWVSGIVPDPSNNGCMVISAGCCHLSLDLGGLYRVSVEKMQPFYLESAVFDI